MRAVQRVAGLERHDPPPAQLAEIGAQLVRRVAPCLEVVMHRRLDAGDRPAETDRAGDIVEVVHRRVRRVVGAVDALRLARLVGRPLVGDREDREDHALGVAQRHVLAGLHALGELCRDVEGDRDRPERAVLKPHPLHHAVVIGLGHEALERRETAVHQQLQIADLPRRQVPGRQVAGIRLQLLCAVIGDVELGTGRGSEVASGLPVFWVLHARRGFGALLTFMFRKGQARPVRRPEACARGRGLGDGHGPLPPLFPAMVVRRVAALPMRAVSPGRLWLGRGGAQSASAARSRSSRLARRAVAAEGLSASA